VSEGRRMTPSVDRLTTSLPWILAGLLVSLQ